MSIDAQASLFGDGGMSPPVSRTTPDPQAVRLRLNGLLATLRSADTMPLSAAEVRMWQIVVPNMSKWLPEHEGQAIRESFACEMERLAAPYAQS